MPPINKDHALGYPLAKETLSPMLWKFNTHLPLSRPPSSSGSSSKRKVRNCSWKVSWRGRLWPLWSMCFNKTKILPKKWDMVAEKSSVVKKEESFVPGGQMNPQRRAENQNRTRTLWRETIISTQVVSWVWVGDPKGRQGACILAQKWHQILIDWLSHSTAETQN